jgi:hypothetical protein
MTQRVQELFTESAIEMTATIPGDMSVDIRDRRLAHTIASLTEKIIRTPGTNPRGLTVTVTSTSPTAEEPYPDLKVVATAPLFA